MKKNLKIKKITEGNVTLLVMMMGFAVILIVTAMTAYLFHDINFAEQDEDRLRALNIAEAGISNMFLNIERFYYEDVSLPSSPYERAVEENGEYAGKFTVEYETEEDGNLIIYNLTSKGTDKSGSERTVTVRINVTNPGEAIDIYDFVYTGQTSTFSGDFKPLDGPFYTEGDLNLTAGSALLQDYGGGPVYVRGNLFMSGDTTNMNVESLSVGGNVVMEGSAKLLGGLVNIAGSLTMSGNTRIWDELESPMIVMGDIDMTSGSPQIGELGRDLILSCNGTINPWPSNSWAPIYATRDDSYTFDFPDTQYSVTGLIDQYYSDVSSSALVINSDLTLDDRNVPYNYQQGENSLSFTLEDGKYVLEVNGNVIINGNLQIGVEVWWVPAVSGPSTNEIFYRGEGVIYTTGNITSNTKLIPLVASDYPENAILVLISEGVIEFDIWRDYWVQPPSCSSPTMYVVSLAKQNIKVTKGVVTGTLIAGGLLDIDTSFSKICYKEGISQSLPEDLPGSPGGGGEVTILRGEWQEIIN